MKRAFLFACLALFVLAVLAIPAMCIGWTMHELVGGGAGLLLGAFGGGLWGLWIGDDLGELVAFLWEEWS